MFSKILPFWFVALLVFSFGCGGDDDGPSDGNNCNRSSECQDGERCNSSGQCSTSTQTCDFSSDCAVDEYCAGGTCALSGCENDDTCVDGFICDNGTCSTGCRENEECGEGEVCSTTNLCVQSGCTTGSCPNFQTCATDRDPPTCIYNGDCESDTQCVAYGAEVGDGEEYICSTAQELCVIKPPCGGDEDCKSNEICEARPDDQRLVCRPGCRGNDDCGAGRICDPNNLLCVRGCAADSDCDPVGGVEYACVDLFCIPTCDTRADCAVAGQVCNGDPQTCKGCTGDSQCPATQFCDFTQGATPDEEQNPVIGLCEDLPPACPDDGFGDNHTENTPFALDTFPYETPSDALPLLCRDKPAGEWFQIDVASGQVVEIELAYSNNDGNMDLALRRQGGEEVVQSAKPPTGDNADNGTEIIRYGVELGGSFLIQIRGTLVNQNAAYTLKVNVFDAPACTDDVLEPNDQLQPVTLPADTDYPDLQVCGDDPDYYELAVAQNQVVTIVASAPVNLGDIDLFLRDDTGNIVETATSSMDVERIDVAIEQAGTYVLEVRVVGAVGTVDYALEWRQADNDCADPFEANDVCPGSPIGAGNQAGLNVCADGDWYEITLSPLQTLTVTATYDRSISAGDLDITLFGPNDCATLVGVGNETSTGVGSVVQEQVVYQAQQGGVFNLQTFLFSGVQATYDLDIDIQDGPPCVDDPSEPNNDQGDATLIDRAGANAGTDNIITGLKICDSDSDYFAIDLVENDVLEWQVSFQHALGDVDVELINPSGIVLDVGDSTDDNEIVGHTVLNGEDGRYYLRVFGKFATRTDYWVLTTLNGTGPADPVCPDLQENNDTRAEAGALAPGSYGLLVCGNPRDDDWFSTTVNPGDTITVDLNFQHAAGNVDLFMYDDTGSSSTVAQSITNTDNESASYTTARQQDIFYQIRTASSVINQSYGLDVTVTPGPVCAGDDFDPNGTFGTAADAPAPGLVGRLTLCEGSEDWFKVSLTAGQETEAFINFDGVLANLDLEVYESNGTTLVGSSTTTTSDESFTFTPATSGDYFIRVFAPNPARLDYDLMVFVDTNNDNILEGPEDRICPDFAENNDVRSQAAELPVGTYDDLLLCWEGGAGNDQDWYSVFVPSGATVTARVDFTHADGDLQLALYRGSAPAAVDQSFTQADFEEVTGTNAGSGTNYVVYVFGGATGFSSYYSIDIGLSFADACVDDANSGANQGSAVAQTTGTYENTLCEGTEDWIELPAGATSVEANVELKNRLGNIDIELLVGGVPVASSVSDGNLESIDVSALGAGTKHLRIFPRDGGFLRNAYDLWLSVDGAQPAAPYCPDSNERDDDESSAESASILATPWYPAPIACGVDEDWLQLTGLFGNSTYEIDVFYDHGVGSDITLEILDDSGTVLQSVDTAANDALSQFVPPVSGSYFVVVSNTGNAATPYDLMVGRDTIYLNGCIEDNFEPNDNAITARTVTVPFDDGLGACGSDDLFRFTATTTGTMEAKLKFDQTKMNLGLQVVRLSDNQTIAFVDNNTDNRETASFAVTNGTQYRVEVLRGLDMNNMFSSGPYFLSIE